MKLFVICVLSALVFLMPCMAQAEKKDAQAYLDAASRLYQERFEDTAAIADVLTKGLAEHPDNIPLLQSRANLYCSRGRLKECRADTQRLLKLKPSLVEARMMLCMLNEREGADRQSCDACYGSVVKALAALPPAPSADAETARRFNYVFALLMARHPDAEKEKTTFLAQTASDSQAWVYRGVLDNFDRERALREVFGQ